MKNIFKIYKRAHVLYNELSDLGIEFEKYAMVVEELNEFILDSYKISQDHYDYFYQRVYDFGNDIITQEELEKELKEG